MALHAPTIHPRQALHVPGWLQVAVALAIAVLLLALLVTLSPGGSSSTDPVLADEAWQQYRAGERESLYTDPLSQQNWLQYRAGERADPFLSAEEKAWLDFRAGERVYD